MYVLTKSLRSAADCTLAVPLCDLLSPAAMLLEIGLFTLYSLSSCCFLLKKSEDSF